MPLEAHSQEKTIEADANAHRFEEILEEQGYLIYTTRGFSMMPLIRQHKDIVEIHPLIVLPKKYDICLYKRRTQYVLHRCISVNPLIFVGDHNTRKEYDVTESMLLGVVTRVIRDGKSIYPDNLLYKIYYHLWVDFFPIRVIILKWKAPFRRGMEMIKHLLK